MEEPGTGDAPLRGGLLVGNSNAGKDKASLKSEESVGGQGDGKATDGNGSGNGSGNNNGGKNAEKNGRAAKAPGTPRLGTFESSDSISRGGRRAGGNGDAQASASGAGTTAKRSHKKGAGSMSAPQASNAALTSMRAQALGDDASSVGGEAGEVEDEPTYCYCNGVSYGEMVACDNEGCVKEWFHLGCVGLKVAPKGNGTYLPLCEAKSFPYWKRKARSHDIGDGVFVGMVANMWQLNGTVTTVKRIYAIVGGLMGGRSAGSTTEDRL
jgi:hypothetical protein